jgi:hypothetical protein
VRLLAFLVVAEPNQGPFSLGCRGDGGLWIWGVRSIIIRFSDWTHRDGIWFRKLKHWISSLVLLTGSQGRAGSKDGSLSPALSDGLKHHERLVEI